MECEPGTAMGYTEGQHGVPMHFRFAAPAVKAFPRTRAVNRAQFDVTKNKKQTNRSQKTKNKKQTNHQKQQDNRARTWEHCNSLSSQKQCDKKGMRRSERANRGANMAALLAEERVAERERNAMRQQATRAAQTPAEHTAMRRQDAKQHQAARHARAAADPHASFQHDVRLACEVFWSMAQPSGAQQLDELLEPIGKLEADELVQRARQCLDGHSFIGGCALCGEIIIRNGTEAPDTVELATLVPRFCVPDEQVVAHCIGDFFCTIPVRLVGTAEPVHIAAQRRFLTEPTTPGSIVAGHVRCIICKRCHLSAVVPPPPTHSPLLLSFSAGDCFADLAGTALEGLSAIERLSLQLVTMFRLVIKIDGAAELLALSSHAIALPTEGAERLASLAQAKGAVTLPRRSVQLDVTFIGTQNRYQQVIYMKENGQLSLRKAWGSVFSVDKDKLMAALQLLVRHNPSYAHVHIDSSSDCFHTLQATIDSALHNARVLSSQEDVALNDAIIANQPGGPSVATDLSYDGSKIPLQAGAVGNPVIFGPVEYHVVASQPQQCIDAGAILDTFQPLITQPCQLPAPVPPRIQLAHQKEPVNEFTDWKLLLEGAFPDLFPLGVPPSWTGMPSDEQLHHLLNQADHRAADCHDFVFAMFDWRKRLAAIRGVHHQFVTTPETLLQLKELLESPGFSERLATAAAAPDTKEAKELATLLQRFVSLGGSQVPYNGTGSERVAYSKLIAMQRFFGSGVFFLTMNPVVHELPLAHRLAEPVHDNWSDPHGTHFRIDAEAYRRKAAISRHPYASAIGYMLQFDTLLETLLSIPRPAKSTRAPPPPNLGSHGGLRPRGICGGITAFFAAQETSGISSQHCHIALFHNVSYRLLQQCAHDAEKSAKIGAFFDSIIATHLPNGPHGWDQVKQKWLSPLLTGFVDLPADEPTVPRPVLPVNSRQPFRTWSFLEVVPFKNNHFPHSASCFKKGHKECRYGATYQCFDQETGCIEIASVPEGKESKKRSRALSRPSVPPQLAQTAEEFAEHLAFDPRIITLQQTRPSLAEPPLRPVADHGPQRVLHVPDPPGPNSWFAECCGHLSRALAVHNNLQIVHAMSGALAYIAKYVTKGDGSDLRQVLPLLNAAMKDVSQRESCAHDRQTNELRGTMFTLTHLINKKGTLVEFAVNTCLSYLLGLDQFEASHSMAYVFVNSALRALRQRLRVAPANDEESGQQQEEIDAARDEEIPGDVQRVGSSVVSTNQEVDYSLRGPDLADMNLVEFTCCLQRVVRRDEQAAQANRIYALSAAHPLAATHGMQIRRKQLIPVLAASAVPPYPGPRRDDWSITEESCWRRKANAWGAYFVAALAPWDTDTLQPPYELSWRGLVDMMQMLCQEKQAGNTIAAGRLNYLQNCAEQSYTTPLIRGTMSDWRMSGATKREEFDEIIRVCGGVPPAEDVIMWPARPQHAAAAPAAASETDEAEHEEQDGAHGPQEFNVHQMHAALELAERLSAQWSVAAQQRTSGAQRQDERDEDVMKQLLLALVGNHNQAPVTAGLQPAAAATLAAPMQPLPAPVVIRTREDVDRDWQVVLAPPATQPPVVRPLPGAGAAPVAVSPGPAGAAVLNPEQQAVYDVFRHHGTADEQLLILLVGAPGTGKTWVANKIRELYAPNESVFVAHTGKAAALHRDGRTIHNAFCFVPQKNKMHKPPGTSAHTKLEQLFGDAHLLGIDEVSMVDPDLFLSMSERLNLLLDVKRPGVVFGGLDVFLLGDFQQLPPVGDSLVSAALEHESPAGALFRRFRRFVLRQQMRAAADPVHQKRIERLSDMSVPFPITSALLRETCELCCAPDGSRHPDPTDHMAFGMNCPWNCPHRCEHLKVLNRADVLVDQSWLTARFVAPCHSTGDRFTAAVLARCSRQTGCPVVQWDLPFSTTGSRNDAELQAAVLAKHDEFYAHFPDLRGCFLAQAPCAIDCNLNTLKKLANGVTATLEELVIAEPLPAAERQPDGSWLIDLHDRPPLAVGLCTTTTELHVQVPSAAARDIKRRRKVKIGAEDGGKQHVVNVVSPGYALAIASTVYGVQGETLSGKLIVDLNKNPSYPRGLSLQSVYVSLSRVKTGCNLRVAPWVRGKAHLLKLSHDDELLRFDAAYDGNGVFHLEAAQPPALKRR